MTVYAIDVPDIEEVRKFCSELQAQTVEMETSILVKPWSGPWPGGLPRAERVRRREEFLANLRAQRQATPVQG